MRLRHHLIALTALLAMNLQVMAAPVLPSCEHEMPQAMTDMSSDHAHHAMQADTPQADCECGCPCAMSCAQTANLTPAFIRAGTGSITSAHTYDRYAPPSPHHAYSHPPLRPPTLS